MRPLVNGAKSNGTFKPMASTKTMGDTNYWSARARAERAAARQATSAAAREVHEQLAQEYAALLENRAAESEERARKTRHAIQPEPGDAGVIPNPWDLGARPGAALLSAARVPIEPI
jgi:hypothetical protein